MCYMWEENTTTVRARSWWYTHFLYRRRKRQNTRQLPPFPARLTQFHTNASAHAPLLTYRSTHGLLSSSSTSWAQCDISMRHSCIAGCFKVHKTLGVGTAISYYREPNIVICFILYPVAYISLFRKLNCVLKKKIKKIPTPNADAVHIKPSLKLNVLSGEENVYNTHRFKWFLEGIST